MARLPGIAIEFQNGQLGQIVETPDGVFGLLASAAAVADTFDLNTPYSVRGMVDVAALGITASVDNYALYKTLKEFYAEAGEGTELWLMGFARDTKVSDWFTPDAGTGRTPAEDLLDAANGNLTMLFTTFFPDGDYVLTLDEGIDADVWAAMAKAQTLADNYTTQKFAPFYTLFEGYGYDGNKVTLKDLTELSYNRCQLLLGDTELRTGSPASKGAAVGVLAGRKAKSQVHVNPGKVADGPLSNITAYILDTPVEQTDIAALHDKGYVTFRTHTGKSGYYFTDDPLATEQDDDYRYGTNRRVIDKAYRNAHLALIDFLLDDTTVNNDGTISPIYAKTIEGKVINTIYTAMTANGELSFDVTNPADRGVICKVDLTHNVTSTSKLKLSQLQVRAKGYNRYIDVPLGFLPVTANN
ncbi:hypothetical protein GCM10007424_23780 [Flavobacterium suaedae]|uniref:DUF2586 family protein n=1 Tax=Flavobacterium suaedae TaxID=1767027 RepID=A0ABQ1JZ59_9FLAO|nr:DUF2586 family protein [Flavobacterium suaedae]GGB83002.1 hypothetical protein GCM10007424_23780 [Flavobacterium suaedae]